MSPSRAPYESSGVMRVAVVTPYHREPAPWLTRCLESVRLQTHPATHFVVADGHPQAWVDEAAVRHLKLDREHSDFGNTPRAVGAILAASEGFDAVAFLDADNWYAADHVERCVAVALAHETVDYVTTERHWARADGSRMALEMGEDSDGSHVDTSCLFLLRGAFHALPRWGLMPKPMAPLGDRFFLAGLRREGLVARATGHRTVFYLCTWAPFYAALGEPAPAFAKPLLGDAELTRWSEALDDREREHVSRLTGYALPARASAWTSRCVSEASRCPILRLSESPDDGEVARER